MNTIRAKSKPFSIPYAEFYVTNVCNLSCQNCNRFNNYAFGGHFKWADHKDDYIAWSKKLAIGKICILGGEPLTNPDLLNWVNGAAELWPNAVIQITSNGAFNDKFFKLYDGLDESVQARFRYDVSAHSAEIRNNTLQDLQEHFGTPVRYDSDNLWHTIFDYASKTELWDDVKDINTFKELSFAEQNYIMALLTKHSGKDADEILASDSISLTYENGFRAFVVSSLNFYDSALELHDDTFHLRHDNDPDEMVRKCYSASSHHFLNGKLYKCPLVTALPEFMKQYNVQMSDANKDLIDAYRPAEHSMSDTELTEIIKSFVGREAIPQCKFCADNSSTTKINLALGKPKVKRL